MIKTTRHISLLLILCLFLVSWGGKGHSAISNKCTESFPTAMNAFKVWADSLNLHASDADNRKSGDPTEKPKHFIDIDNYAEFLTNGRIFSTYDSIVGTGKNQHSASFVSSNGILPWTTRTTYDTLKIAFKERKWHKAMLVASDLGHYVADGHMPLHISANYDGQNTGQSGVHSRYESDMVYNYYATLINYTGFSVAYVGGNVNKYIFEYIYKNQRYVDSVLIADKYAVGVDATYGTAYSAALWSKTKFTTNLFKNASHALAELIYSAWIDAGSPAFGSLAAVNSPTEMNIQVYPNPSSGMVNIVGENVRQTEVTDLTGKLLGRYYGNKIDLHSFSKGMYVLSIYCNDGQLQKEKLILCK